MAVSDFRKVGINYTGQMTWWGAMAWAENLVYGGFDDWRLPHTLPVNGTSYNYLGSYDGSTDMSYNISAPESPYPGTHASEMSFMYYSSLGNIGNAALDGTWNPPGWGFVTAGPFMNIIVYSDLWYWSGNEGIDFNRDMAWHFLFHWGAQNIVMAKKRTGGFRMGGS